jgi:hypothetical protein
MHTQQGYSPGAGPPGGCSVAGAESPDWQTPRVVVTLSDVVAVDLEQRVASAVNAQLQSMNDDQLQSMNGRLEELVERALQDELDRRVAAILEANIEQRANATPPGRAPDDVGRVDDVVTKTCNACGKAKPLHRFEKQRGTCMDCRRVAARESARRRAEAADTVPFTGAASTSSPSANPGNSSG